MDTRCKFMSSKFLTFYERIRIQRQLTPLYTFAPKWSGLKDESYHLWIRSNNGHRCSRTCRSIARSNQYYNISSKYQLNKIKKWNTFILEVYGKNGGSQHLKIFGCLAYLYVHKEERTKIDLYKTLYIMVGYDSTFKTYLFYNFTKQKILITKDVKFNELEMAFAKYSSLPILLIKIISFFLRHNNDAKEPI